MDAIGYARIVPLENGEAALAHQKTRIAEYCRQNKLALAKIFEETVSAEVPLSGRTELLAALSEAGPNACLVIVRADRLGANRKILQEINEICGSKQIAVHTVHGPIDLAKVKPGIEVTVSQ